MEGPLPVPFPVVACRALKSEGTTACILIDVIAMKRLSILAPPIKLVVPGFSQPYDNPITPANVQFYSGDDFKPYVCRFYQFTTLVSTPPLMRACQVDTYRHKSRAS